MITRQQEEKRRARCKAAGCLMVLLSLQLIAGKPDNPSAWGTGVALTVWGVLVIARNW